MEQTASEGDEMITAPYGVGDVQKGDRVGVERVEGYRLHQERPFACRDWGCKCGECNGVGHTYPGTVTQIIRWADNSVEASVACDDGKSRSIVLTPPSEF